jgi:2-hydroxychromene-2-carboxylate isomerase
MQAPRVSKSCLIAVCLLAAACAAEPKKAESTTPAAQTAAADGGEQCDDFTARLCDALGNDAEACMSMRSVREWLPAAACAAAGQDLPGVLARVKDLRRPCDTLAQKLCADMEQDPAGCSDVTQQIAQVPADRCAGLLTHYPELAEQARERLERLKPLSPALWQELLAGTPPTHGSDTAKVTIVEFSDFQCPYCAAAGDTVKQIRAKYGDKVRIVFRQFPLSFHEHAREAAHAALAAHAQGKFWALHDLLFEHQGALDRKSLEGWAKQAGVDLAKWNKSMDDAALDAQVEADLELGRKVKVDGTPTMFVNGKRADNPTELESVEPLIEAGLAQ